MNMTNTMYEEPVKPSDWPINNKECTLENIMNAVNKFVATPNSHTKELILSLTANYDLNQSSHIGMFRVTDYEVAITNSLWMCSQIYNIPSIKFILYDIIEDNIRFQKLSCHFNPDLELYIESYKRLMPSLKLLYYVYVKYSFNKSKSLCETLIEYFEPYVNNSNPVNDTIDLITHAYTQMLRDISDFHSKKLNGNFAFARSEIYKLYELQAKLLKLNNDSITQRDLRGTLMISISNYILKSRANYNDNYICKYISPENAEKTFSNEQIWLRDIKFLNDEREQKVVPELFEDTSWLSFNWAKEIDLTAKREYYVSSFCKNYKNNKMKNMYGECIYGYKNDRIIELIAPILKTKNTSKCPPMLSQVIAFDILYDSNEIKDEINFLCQIINLFEISDKEKHDFFQEIMQYWIISIKDSKWSYEQERRYVIFQYPTYEYKDAIIEDNFLKVETSLFLYPDFILGNNPIHSQLEILSNKKRNAISMKEYMHCNNCLSNDFDNVWINPCTCPICGSKNYIKVPIRVEH